MTNTHAQEQPAHYPPTIVLLKQSEYEEWDTFVGNHPFGLIYHLSSWKEAIERAFSHIKGYILVLRAKDTGNIIAGLPVYSIRSWLFGNRMVSIPYASISDPLISSIDQLRILQNALNKLQNDLSIKSIAIQTVKTAAQVAEVFPSISQNHLHHYLPINRPINDIYKALSRSTRRNINRANLPEIRVTRHRDESSLHIFKHLSMLKRTSLGLPLLPPAFFDSLHQSFKNDKLEFFLAKRDDEIIGGLLTLIFHGTLHLEYSGITPGGDQIGLANLLIWEAIQYASKSGCDSVSFGQTELNNTGLIDFKKRWSFVDEPIFFAQTHTKNQTSIRNLRWAKKKNYIRWIFTHTPFPVRRLLSSLFYHHHG